MKLFSIVLDDRQPIYYPGQTVTGRVVLQLDEDMTKVRYIKINFRGWARVSWQEKASNGQGGSTTVTYQSKEVYFSQDQMVFTPDNNESTAILPRGNYNYPFRYTIPAEVPSSYNSHIGHVLYGLRAHIDRAMGFDKHTETFITVNRPLDLNTVTGATAMVEGTKSKQFCCMCCKSEPVEVVLRVERLGYVPGDTVVMWADIENRSSRKMKSSKLRLVMRVKYTTSKKSTFREHVLLERKHGEIGPGCFHSWERETFQLPSLPPSHLEKCGIIHIEYAVKLTVNPVVGLDLTVPLEIIVGTIPLEGIAKHHFDGTKFSPGHENSVKASFVQATYEESVVGRPLADRGQSPSDQDSSHNPVYPYYKWNKTDPTSNFTVAE